ncbi:MAG TPA: hypothetical protein PJ988_00420 [Anaerolinea sp.]|nr:hypothetical protein [Anaerolinea sp.]
MIHLHRPFSILAALIILLTLTSAPVFGQEPPPPPAQEDVPTDLSAGPPPEPLGGAPSGYLEHGPDYDSGWVAIGQDQTITLNHALGGLVNDYVVNMEFRAPGVDGINQRYFGGMDFGEEPGPGHAPNDRVGAYWRSLTTSSITIYRRPEDTYANEIRIRIWVDRTAAVDSGWINVTPEVTQTFTHNIGGSVNDYVVDMQYKDGAGDINLRYYSGNDFGLKSFDGTVNNDRVGAYWCSLTTTTITYFRRAEDTYAAQVRFRFWLRPKPAYDSGWVALGVDAAQTLAHNLGGIPEDYVVDLQFDDSAGNGVNQRSYGGMDVGNQPSAGTEEDDRVGAYWRSLNATSVIIYRRPQDGYAVKMRLRIWAYWTPTRPHYDSGWSSIAADTALAFTHNLGGSTANYLVDVSYRSAGVDGINQRYTGGMDFAAGGGAGHVADDRVGAYWRSLTTTSVVVYRRPEDTYAEQVRVRIWVMPKPDYDSGWFALAQDTASTLTHNLGGTPDAYLVDMQYYDTTSDGINQRALGGMDVGAKPSAGLAENNRIGMYWRSLSGISITLYRRPEDIYADLTRLRIWRIAKPDYSNGWTSLNVDAGATLAHNLGGIPECYLTQMMYFNSGVESINQRALGGMDVGNLPSLYLLENDQVGAYWRSLDRSSVVIYRRPQDIYAEQVLLQIWSYCQSTYLPTVMK